MDDLDNAVQIEPHNFNLCYARAVAHIKLGQIDEALHDYSVALSEDTYYPVTSPSLNRIRHHLSLKDISELDGTENSFNLQLKDVLPGLEDQHISNGRVTPTKKKEKKELVVTFSSSLPKSTR